MDNPIILILIAIVGSTAFTEIIKLIKSFLDRKEIADAEIKEQEIKLKELEVEDAEIVNESKLSEYYKGSYNEVMKRLSEVEAELRKTQEQLKKTNELLRTNNEQVRKMKTDIKRYLKTIAENEKEIIMLRKRCKRDDCPNKVA